MPNCRFCGTTTTLSKFSINNEVTYICMTCIKAIAAIGGRGARDYIRKQFEEIDLLEVL